LEDCLVGDRFLEIVVFLISQLKDDQGRLENIDEISAYLKNQGFSDNEISTAYTWVLDRLQSDTEFFCDTKRNASAVRVLSDSERHHFTSEAIGYLMQLAHFGIIAPEQVESIMERGMMIWPAPVTLEQIKILADSVLFSDSVGGDSPRDIHYYIAEDNNNLN